MMMQVALVICCLHRSVHLRDGETEKHTECIMSSILAIAVYLHNLHYIRFEWKKKKKKKICGSEYLLT